MPHSDAPSHRFPLPMMHPVSARSAVHPASCLLLLLTAHRSSARPLQSQPDSPSPSMPYQASHLLHRLPDRSCFLPGAHRLLDLPPVRTQIRRSRLHFLLSPQSPTLVSDRTHLSRHPFHQAFSQTHCPCFAALLPAYLHSSLCCTPVSAQAEY